MLGLWSKRAVEPAATATGGGTELALAVDDQAPARMDFGYTFVAADPDRRRLRGEQEPDRGGLGGACPSRSRRGATSPISDAVAPHPPVGPVPQIATIRHVAVVQPKWRMAPADGAPKSAEKSSAAAHIARPNVDWNPLVPALVMLTARLSRWWRTQPSCRQRR